MSVAVVAWRCMCARPCSGDPMHYWLRHSRFNIFPADSVQSFALCRVHDRRPTSRSRPGILPLGAPALGPVLGDVLHALPGPILYCAVRRHTPVITTEQTYDRPIVAFDSLGPRSSGSRPKAP